jgi:pyruvate dehydrogenase E2 component (dihydrolipoamide acetyltransferase)
MPKLGLTMQEGTVVEWRCREGDAVRRGQVVLLIESEKVEFEVESPTDGVVRALVVEPGRAVPCGAVIALLTEREDEPFDRESALAELRAGSASAAPAATPEADALIAAPRASPSRSGRARTTPRARRLARAEGIDLEAVEGSGPGGRIGEEDVRRAVEALGPRVSLDGVRIGYADEGQGEPLVLLAGFGLDRPSWNVQTRELSSHRRVLVPDPRGTGASSDADESAASIAEFAGDVLGLLAALDVECADLVGSSLGAAVALEAALAAPTRIRRLVLLNPVFEADARLRAVLEGFCRVAEGADPEARLRVMAPWFFAPAFLDDSERLERTVRGLAGAVARVSPRTLRRQAEALYAWLATSGAALERLTPPLLVVAGEQDVLTPPRHAERLVRACPRARLEVLSGVGHAPMVEAPDRLHALLDQFLS